MKFSKQSTQKLLILTSGLALFLALGGAGFACPFFRIFGVICPGCGMTRAFLACLQLDFASAWRYHPMVFSLPLLALLFWKDGRVFQSKALNLSLGALMLAGFLISYIYKLFYLQ